MQQTIQKPKIAIESITGCAGCQLTIYFQERLPEILDRFDIVSAPMIKGRNDYEHVDIIFLEGTIVNQEDLERVKRLREKCTVLVAIGECAVHGCVPTIKYQKDSQKIDIVNAAYGKPVNFGNIDPVPIDKHVKVDYYIKGCPVDKKEFENFLIDFSLGKRIVQYSNPLCYKCNLRENDCLLEQGKKCLGPITDGNCSVMCPSYSTACTGCRGFIDDANLDAYIALLRKKGYTNTEIENSLHKYAALQYKELLNAQHGIKPDAVQATIEKKVSAPAKTQGMTIKKKTARKTTTSEAVKKVPKKKVSKTQKPAKTTRTKKVPNAKPKRGIFHILKEKLKIKKRK